MSQTKRYNKRDTILCEAIPLPSGNYCIHEGAPHYSVVTNQICNNISH